MHQPQVLRRVGHRQPYSLSERLDAALPLGEQLQNFQPPPVTECLGNLGKAGEERALRILA